MNVFEEDGKVLHALYITLVDEHHLSKNLALWAIARTVHFHGEEEERAMSEGEEKNTPDGTSDKTNADFQNFMDQFAAELGSDPMQEAWVGFHEMYLGLLSGGFTVPETMMLLSRYLYLIVQGEGE